MSIHGFATNAETLLVLAWAARAGLQKVAQQAHKAHRDTAKILRDKLLCNVPVTFSLESVYSPVYQALFIHRLNMVDFEYVGWALRGYNAVYLAPEADQEEALKPGTLSPETGVFLETLTNNEHVLYRVKQIAQKWKHNKQRAAQVLQIHFLLRMPLTMRIDENSFLFQELVAISLSQVNWQQLTLLLLETQDTSLQANQSAQIDDIEKESELAALKELLCQSGAQISEQGQYPLFSQKLRALSSSLADHCYQTSKAIQELEKSGTVYRDDADLPFN